MKIKKEFVLRNVYGENALVPVGDSASSLKKIIKVNELGSFIWNNLESAKNEDEINSTYYHTIFNPFLDISNNFCCNNFTW